MTFVMDLLAPCPVCRQASYVNAHVYCIACGAYRGAAPSPEEERVRKLFLLTWWTFTKLWFTVWKMGMWGSTEIRSILVNSYYWAEPQLKEQFNRELEELKVRNR